MVNWGRFDERYRGDSMECFAALKRLARHKLLVTEGQQQRQQTADSGQQGPGRCLRMQTATKTRGRAAEWFCVSNLACSPGVRPLMLVCWAPKLLEGLLEELLAALGCAERDGSRI